MLINFFLVVGLLIVVSLGYSGIKFFIHNFINFPYNGQLWIYYAVFYFFFFSFCAILSNLLKYFMLLIIGTFLLKGILNFCFSQALSDFL